MDNYQVSKERAQQYFLRFDQEKIMKDWNLSYDEDYLYTHFFSDQYRICRSSGKIEKSIDDFQAVEEAGFEEVLSIFDFFCHESETKVLNGIWTPVNSLNGRPSTIGVGTDFYQKISNVFDKDIELFKKVCEKLGGEAVPYGDVGYQFSVFGDFSIILKFYYSDDEFPAQITILWDENTLQFLYYETTFYIAGYILKTIEKNMY